LRPRTETFGRVRGYTGTAEPVGPNRGANRRRVGTGGARLAPGIYGVRVRCLAEPTPRAHTQEVLRHGERPSRRSSAAYLVRAMPGRRSGGARIFLTTFRVDHDPAHRHSRASVFPTCPCGGGYGSAGLGRGSRCSWQRAAGLRALDEGVARGYLRRTGQGPCGRVPGVPERDRWPGLAAGRD